jgi:hypothetical protein
LKRWAAASVRDEGAYAAGYAIPAALRAAPVLKPWMVLRKKVEVAARRT